MSGGHGVVGIDLSLTSTGLAFINPDNHRIEIATIGSKGKRADSLHSREVRITTLANNIVDWACALVDPELAVIEAPSFGSSGGSAFDRAGLWWQIVRGLRAAEVPVVQVAPTTRAKYLSGDGRADKKVVMAHAIETYTDLLMAGKRITKDDEADAIGLAAMGARWLGWPVEAYELPVKNLEAMRSPKWAESVVLS